MQKTLAYNHRKNARVPTHMFVDQIFRDRLKKGLATDVSEEGLLIQSIPPNEIPAGEVIQLEFRLPFSEERIWAQGKVVYQLLSPHFRSTGIQFTYMAENHRGLIKKYISMKKYFILSSLLQRISNNRVN